MGCGASSGPNIWVGNPKSGAPPPQYEQSNPDADVPAVQVDGFDHNGSLDNTSHAESAEGDPQRASSKPKLPAGWDSKIDPETGAVYYLNHADKSTAWVVPEETGSAAHLNEAAGSPEQSLPPGWTRKIDPESNIAYYANHATKQTQWEIPSS